MTRIFPSSEYLAEVPMSEERVPMPERDYKGMNLCIPCWNGRHYHPERRANGTFTGKMIRDCLGGVCQCLCCKLLAEMEAVKEPKPLKDEPTLFEVGTPAINHRYDN